MVVGVKAKLLMTAGAVALLGVLYVLSIGPAFRVGDAHLSKVQREWKNGKLSLDAVRRADERLRALVRFYGPVSWVCERSDGVAALVRWYVIIWSNPEVSDFSG